MAPRKTFGYLKQHWMPAPLLVWLLTAGMLAVLGLGVAITFLFFI